MSVERSQPILPGAARLEVAAKVFLGALWAVCVYRAATQSIVHDEALTYRYYLAVPPSRMFTSFDANHHFLNTLLMSLSVSLFGISEWSMRLPALAGAVLYFAAVYRVSRYVFGAGYTFLMAVALLTLDPFVLDFMVAARGYGMALGFWMWALALLAPYIENPKTRTSRKLVEAAIALSLSVVANLVFVMPAAMLAGLTLWLLGKRLGKTATRSETAEPSTMVYFALPILSMAIVFFLVSPVHSAKGADFYAGVSTIPDSLQSLATASLAHSGPYAQTRLAEWLSNTFAFFLAPAILVVALAVGIRRRDALMLLCSTTAVGSALLLVALHLASNAPYPIDRTGVYFPPLVLLALVRLAYSGAGGKGVTIAAYALAVSLLLAFGAQWNVHKFFVWAYDADTKDIALQISVRAAGGSPNSVRVASAWQFDPALSFYRDKNRWTWMQPVSRDPEIQGFDYYVMQPWRRPLIERLGLKLVYQGKTTGNLLAARNP